jgi:hypothetical protein
VAFVVTTSGNPFIDRMVRLKTSPSALRSVWSMCVASLEKWGELRERESSR